MDYTLKMAMWHETGHTAEVTCIERNPKGNAFAVGYADGSVRLWDPQTKGVIATFNGHKKAVTSLAFDRDGVRFASGSQDTDLIVWDVVGEAGLFRCVVSYFAPESALTLVMIGFEVIGIRLPQSASFQRLLIRLPHPPLSPL